MQTKQKQHRRYAMSKGLCKMQEKYKSLGQTIIFSKPILTPWLYTDRPGHISALFHSCLPTHILLSVLPSSNLTAITSQRTKPQTPACIKAIHPRKDLIRPAGLTRRASNKPIRPPQESEVFSLRPGKASSDAPSRHIS